jgi:membrane associated rhomboid family serine protease
MDAIARRLPFGAVAVGGLVLAMWCIEFVDTYVLSDRLQRNGIQPRDTEGIDGILWAPFLHSDWRHLVSNSAPFLLLSALVAVRGFRHWVQVTVIAALLGGALTWLFGATGNHIGSSGVVFGYLGSLLGLAVFERSMRAAAPAAVAVLLYSSMLIGLVPQQGISWEGHLAGFLVGFAVARKAARPRPSEPEEPPIVGDEYWLA